MSSSESNPEIARFFALSQPKLRAFIRSMVFSQTDADDIMQDVVVIAIENSHRFDPRRSVNAWVFGIARKRVLKHYEKTKRRKVCFSTEMVEALTDAAQEDEAAACSLDALQGCLGKLDEEKRTLLVQRHQPGTTARKLAQELGYSDTRMSRLLNSLYATLMKCVQREITGASS